MTQPLTPNEHGLPTPDQLEALETFRKKWSDKHRRRVYAFRDWKEALGHAWASGGDEREPGAQHLRSVRNDPQTNHAWLRTQPKQSCTTVKEL